MRILIILIVGVMCADLNAAELQNAARAPTPQFATSPDGVRIAFEDHGRGAPALVFVHGWSCDRTYWRGQLAAFAKRHRVVAVDLGGHGDSDLNRASWTIASFGEDVAAAIKQLDLKEVVLIGHSMGGDVIVEAARRLDGRVKGLVMVDTYWYFDKPRDQEKLNAFFAKFRADFQNTTRTFVGSMFFPGADPALVERVALDMSSAPPSVALPAMESSFAHYDEMPRALQELQAPVVALNADSQPTDTASLKRHGVDAVIEPGVGHFFMLEDPQRFNEVLAQIIQRWSTH